MCEGSFRGSLWGNSGQHTPGNKTLDSFYKEARQAAEGPLLSWTPTCREVRTPAASLSPLLLLEFCRGWTRLGTQDCSQANEGGFPPTAGPPLH